MKNKIVTIIIVISTILLAGIAVFTAIRLYQLRQESVTPAAPESEPGAAPITDTKPPEEAEELAGSGQCAPLTFTITPKVPGLECSDKLAYKNDSRNTAGNYFFDEKLNPGSRISRNQKFVYVLKYQNTGNKKVNSAVITDTLPNMLKFVDAQQGCTNNAGVVTCTVGEVGIGVTGQKAIRVSLATDAEFDTEFTNEAKLDPIEGSDSFCSIMLKTVEQGATATPAPTATATAEPDATATATPKATKTPTAEPAAPTDAPAVPTEPPSLPDAGVSAPTLISLGAGVIFLIAALALAL